MVSCNHAAVKNDATISFVKHEYDFKKIAFKSKAFVEVKFENPGDTPLLIQNIDTGCGCVKAEHSHKPIKPHKKGSIIINYDTKFPGLFQKSIYVYFNGKKSPQKIQIKGYVEYPEDSNS